MSTRTREGWLQHAVAFIRGEFPDVDIPEVAASCSWPGGGSPARRIGECWARAASKAGINEVFISPTQEDPARVMGVLAHELAHAVDDCAHGHRAPFTRIARRLGCEGKATSMAPPEPVLAGWAARMLSMHGPFPHRTLDKAQSGQKKQSTRMLKCACGACGAVWRLSAKVLAACEHGMFCPACGETGEWGEGK